MKTLKRKTLAALLAFSLLASLLPLGAQPALAAAPENQVIYVGGENVTSGGYWTTDSDGNVTASTAGDTPTDHYIHYDAENNVLTLHNATIKEYVSSGTSTYVMGAAIGVLSESGAAELTIELEGDNTIEDVSTGIFVLAHSSSTGDATLTITGSGSLNASGSLNGIMVQSNSGDATLTIQSAVVTLTSNSGNGVTVQAGSNSSASLSVDRGNLTATGSGSSCLGIYFYVPSSPENINLTVSNNAIVRANGGIASGANLEEDVSTSGTGIVFDDNEGTVYGAVTLQDDLAIGEGESLNIPDGSRLTIPDGKTLTVNGGELTGNVPQSGVAYKVTDVSLNKTSLTLTEGGSETLTATITPDNASNKSLTWSSDNQNVATVENGKVTAVGAGTAQITVTTEDGNKTATCTVTVIAKTYSLSVDPSTLNFGSITEGEERPAAQTVTVKNTGNQRVTLVQPTAENFEIAKIDKLTLNAGESVKFTIHPKDNLPRGSYSEQIVIAGDNNASATLTATFTVKEPPYTGKYSYELSTSVGDHGSLTVDRYATEGDEVTITVTPDDAYLLDELVVTANGKDVELTAGADGTFSFTMPSADVKITATFAEDPDWTEPEEPATDVSDIFIDIAANAWYKDAVQYAYDSGLMTGVSANEFAPEQTTTRAMIVSMLARLEGVQHSEAAGFNDVAANDWYATAISSWANDVMSWAVAEGLISGVTADTLQPQGAATRAQVAAILQRFLSE